MSEFDLIQFHIVELAFLMRPARATNSALEEKLFSLHLLLNRPVRITYIGFNLILIFCDLRYSIMSGGTMLSYF